MCRYKIIFFLLKTHAYNLNSLPKEIIFEVEIKKIVTCIIIKTNTIFIVHSTDNNVINNNDDERTIIEMLSLKIPEQHLT